MFGRDKLDWLRQYRPFENGIPVDDTIARIVRVICPEQLNKAFMNWVNEVRVETGKPQIAIDGKTLRHSYDGDKQTALHSITAWSKDAGLVLAQLKSSGKKNENASVLDLLDTLNIKGALISADANIPRKRNNKLGNDDMDWCLYRYRHLVENAFLRIKRYRAISTRYDKLARNYSSTVALAFMMMWLPMYC